jgi:hypothetical protein
VVLAPLAGVRDNREDEEKGNEAELFHDCLDRQGACQAAAGAILLETGSSDREGAAMRERDRDTHAILCRCSVGRLAALVMR